MGILIPPDILAEIPGLADQVRNVFKRKRKIYERTFIGSIKIGNRSISVSVEDIFHSGRTSKRTMACYNYMLERIIVYRSAVQEKLPRFAVERVLAHEIAHALDRERIALIWRSKMRRTKHEYKRRGFSSKRYRIQYSCTRTEFDAEMASILQVGIPSLLNRPDAPKIIEDYFGHRNIFPLNRYRPFRDLTFTGYIGNWSHNSQLCNEFFKIFSNRLWKEWHRFNYGRIERAPDTDRPIIDVCQTPSSRISPRHSRGESAALVQSCRRL